MVSFHYFPDDCKAESCSFAFVGAEARVEYLVYVTVFYADPVIGISYLGVIVFYAAADFYDKNFFVLSRYFIEF